MRSRGSVITPLALLACAAIVSPAHAQSPDTSLWVTDGSVASMVRVGGTLYIGGQFSHVAPHLGSAVPFDPNTGQPQQPFARVSGSVNAVVADGAGGWFVGGRFFGVAGAPRRNLVHLLPDGSAAPWAPDPDSEVMALARSGSTLYVGGRFEHLGGQPRYKVGAVYLGTGAATAFDPNPPKPPFSIWPWISSLTVHAGVVYAGGWFQSIGGQPRPWLAALDPGTGLATTWDPHANGPVVAMAAAGDTMYVAGSFTSIGGASRFLLAQLNLATATATAWDPHPDAAVDCLVLDSSRLFVGGIFSNIAGSLRRGAAGFDRLTGSITAFNPNAMSGGFASTVRGLAATGATVYAAGEFTSIGGQPRRYLAALDPVSGAASTWDPDVNASAVCVAANGTTVFAGGYFWTAGGVPRSNLAAMDLATGHPTSWAPEANDRVRTMASDGTSLYIGGFFQSVQGLSHHYLAKLDLASGAPAAWDPQASDVVTKVRLAGPTLYVAGYFNLMGGSPHATVAQVDAAGGATLAWNPSTTSGPSHDILPDPQNNAVFVASQGGLWCFRRTDGVLLWTGVLDNSGIPVAFVRLGATLYVGGRFISIAGQPRANLAALNPVNGDVLPWAPDADGLVMSLISDGSRVFACGEFSNVGGAARVGFAVLDPVSNVTGSFDAQLTGSVNDATLAGTELFLTGRFGACADVAMPGFAGLPAPPPLGVPPSSLALRLDVAPMPAVSTTRLSWTLPAPGRVWLDVLDVQGRRVASLLDGVALAAGPDWRTLDTHDWRPGVYLARLRTPTARVVRRIVVER